MTVCNMTIEAGGRAGMVAPDDTHVRLARGARRSQIDDALARAAHRRSGAGFDTEVDVDAGAVARWSPGGPTPRWSSPVTERGPEPHDEGDERALAYMGLRPGTPIQEIAIDRVFIGSCTNSRIGDLRAAAEVVRGRRVADGVDAMVVPGSEQVKRPGRGRGARRGVPRRGLRVAHRGLLDVPGDEPRHPRARRALRLDLEPQLRGPPGPRRPHAPRQPGDGRGGGRRRATSSTSGSGSDGTDRVDRGRVSVLPRDDVDTDQIIPKQFLKRVERTGFGEYLFDDWAKEPGWDLPRNPILVAGRTSAAARAASMRRGRWRTTASARSSRPASPTSSGPTAPRSACCPCELAEAACRDVAERGAARASTSRPRPSTSSPSRSTPTPSTGCSTASTTSGSRSSARSDRRLRGERERSGPVTTAL